MIIIKKFKILNLNITQELKINTKLVTNFVLKKIKTEETIKEILKEDNKSKKNKRKIK